MLRGFLVTASSKHEKLGPAGLSQDGYRKVLCEKMSSLTFPQVGVARRVLTNTNNCIFNMFHHTYVAHPFMHSETYNNALRMFMFLIYVCYVLVTLRKVLRIRE
jgi:hypothetical protein